MNLNEKFLCSDGIIRETKPIFLKYLRYNKKFQMWSNDEYEKFQDVTDLCIFIANAFFNKIGEQDPYVIEFQSKNLHIFDCGLTSESNLTKEKFSELLDKLHNEYGVPRETINGSPISFGCKISHFPNQKLLFRSTITGKRILL